MIARLSERKQLYVITDCTLPTPTPTLPHTHICAPLRNSNAPLMEAPWRRRCAFLFGAAHSSVVHFKRMMRKVFLKCIHENNIMHVHYRTILYYRMPAHVYNRHNPWHGTKCILSRKSPGVGHKVFAYIAYFFGYFFVCVSCFSRRFSDEEAQVLYTKTRILIWLNITCHTI